MTTTGAFGDRVGLAALADLADFFADLAAFVDAGAAVGAEDVAGVASRPTVGASTVATSTVDPISVPDDGRHRLRDAATVAPRSAAPLWWTRCVVAAAASAVHRARHPRVRHLPR